MINTPPSERPRLDPPGPLQSFAPTQGSDSSTNRLSAHSLSHGPERDNHGYEQPPSFFPRTLDDQYPAAATAAVALAQLSHNNRPDSDWGSEAVGRKKEHRVHSALIRLTGLRVRDRGETTNASFCGASSITKPGRPATTASFP